MKKISICIPTYNRVELLFDSFESVIDMPEIGEVVIVDDCSNEDIFRAIQDRKRSHKHGGKISLFNNHHNLDCYKNKQRAVSLSATDYLILLDSDNKIGPDYINAIYNQHWSPGRILQPVFAKPLFDFSVYNSLLVHKSNVSMHVSNGNFTTMLNAMNYFVHRDTYLEVWDGSIDPVTSDSIYFNYLWLKAGHSIYVTPMLEYEHRVDDHKQEEASHYAKNNKRTPKGFHESIIRNLKYMK